MSIRNLFLDHGEQHQYLAAKVAAASTLTGLGFTDISWAELAAGATFFYILLQVYVFWPKVWRTTVDHAKTVYGWFCRFRDWLK